MMESLPTMKRIDPSMFEHERIDVNDDAPVLNAMFDYVSEHAPEGAIIDWSGEYVIADTVRVRGEAMQHMAGAFTVIGDLEHALEIDAPRASFSGIIRVEGPGLAVYEARSVSNLVVLGNVWGARFDGFFLRGAIRSGITVRNDGGAANIIDADLGSVGAIDCGSPAGVGGQGPHPSKLQLAFTARSDDGIDTSVAQYSRLTVDFTGFIGHLRPGDIVFIEDAPYLVKVVNEDNDRLDVYPKVADFGLQSGLIECSHGAAVETKSGNTTGFRCERIACQRVGVGYRAAGLYSGDFGGITTEACGIGVLLASFNNTAHLGGHIGQVHFEATKAHIIKTNRNPVPFTISSFVIFDPSKMHGLTNNGQSGPNSRLYAMFRGLRFLYNGAAWGVEHAHRVNNNTFDMVSNEPGKNKGTLVADNPTITISWNDDANRLFGYDTIELICVGKDGNSPGTVTLDTDDGSIVEGDDDHTIEADCPIRITLVRLVAQGDWRVYTSPV